MPSPLPPLPPPGADGTSQRRNASSPAVSVLWWVTGPVLAALLVSAVAVGASRVPYFAFSPGGARPVESLVTVRQVPGGPKVHAEPADRDLLYLTVSQREVTAIEALIDVLDPAVQVEPSAPYLGSQTSDENRKLNLALMTESQDKARRVALERLGYKVASTPQGAFIEDIDPSYPVAKVMKPGATVIGADGKPVKSADQLVAAIGTHRPGDTLSLRFLPLGSTRPTSITVKLGRRTDDPTKAALGVQPVDKLTYSYPIDIRIDTEKVGGPSAGLAFTLAILDRLTPGSLLGKERVAVTGTIELDGSVGPVGGVQHKARAAISQGAKLMIVPPDEYALAKQTAGKRLHVERAATLDQALAILRRFGGDPLPAAKVP